MLRRQGIKPRDKTRHASIVILSAASASRSEADADSKDPKLASSAPGAPGNSHRTAACVKRVPPIGNGELCRTAPFCPARCTEQIALTMTAYLGAALAKTNDFTTMLFG